ncbi:hypothetical protein VdG1_06376 [Verticillium dahliae VDG1]|nr:hypothetical protein VdG1_06376 [Verticillium dahliae VDG1]PNH77476.1 hypothetical protein VD0001_g2 [Verticillium dahliae]
MSGNMVPSILDGNVPIAGLDQLSAHLDEAIQDPDADFKPKLFDDVELQLTEFNVPPLLPTLLPKLTTILLTTRKDPAVPVSLSLRLLRHVSFTQTLSLADETALITAFNSPAPSANLLAMAVLHKATTPADIAILASMPKLLEHFIRRWLSAPQVEVGERGTRVLGDLLEIDSQSPPLRIPREAITVNGVPWTNGSTNGDHGNDELVDIHKPRGEGVLWRRLTHDVDLYNLLLALPQGRDISGEVLDDRQTSLAQGRLLRLLPRLALRDFDLVTQPPPKPSDDELMGGVDPEVEARQSGLLQFVALKMVDKSDLLMHLSLIDFFETLVSLLRVRAKEAGSSSQYIVQTLREILSVALRGDDELRAALKRLPDRTVEEEAEDLRLFIASVVG